MPRSWASTPFNRVKREPRAGRRRRVPRANRSAEPVTYIEWRLGSGGSRRRNRRVSLPRPPPCPRCTDHRRTKLRAPGSERGRPLLLTARRGAWHSSRGRRPASCSTSCGSSDGFDTGLAEPLTRVTNRLRDALTNMKLCAGEQLVNGCSAPEVRDLFAAPTTANGLPSGSNRRAGWSRR